MKTSLKITTCGIVSAIAAVIMLVSHLGVTTYAAPAVAGIILLIPYFEIGRKPGLLCYIVSALLVLLMAELEAKILYIGFFGYYPMLKFGIEKIKPKVVSWIVKIAAFNIAVVLSYAVIISLLGMSATFDTERFGVVYTLLGFLAAGNAVFVLYDIALSKLAVSYIVRFRTTLRKLMRIK